MKSSYRYKTELNMKFNSSKMSIRIREKCSWNILFKLFAFYCFIIKYININIIIIIYFIYLSLS